MPEQRPLRYRRSVPTELFLPRHLDDLAAVGHDVSTGAAPTSGHDLPADLHAAPAQCVAGPPYEVKHSSRSDSPVSGLP
jgi:hypothetical protein